MCTKFQSPGGWLECVQGFYLPLTACATELDFFEQILSSASALGLSCYSCVLRPSLVSSLTDLGPENQGIGLQCHHLRFQHFVEGSRLLVHVGTKNVYIIIWCCWYMKVSKFRSCIAGTFWAEYVIICHHFLRPKLFKIKIWLDLWHSQVWHESNKCLAWAINITRVFMFDGCRA